MVWTHRNPYQKPENTYESIRYHGEMALNRALNVKRVMVFAGSGVSMAYGRPTWEAVVEAALESVDNLVGEIRNSTSQSTFLRIERMRNSIAELVGCEQFNESDESTYLKSSTSWRSNTELYSVLLEAADNFASQCATETRQEKWASFARNHVAALFTPIKATQPGKGQPEAEIIKSWVNTSGTANDIESPDPYKIVIDDLKIKRFLTINYDLEIERKYHFDNSELSLPMVQADGFSRRLRSVSMHPDNIVELVNFAIHPNLFGIQVFHLHGSYDNSESMILTEADYQRTYMQKDESRRVFDEALECLFDGNDVLFLGVGMRESEFLRPLRQFAGRDKVLGSDPRRVFAFLPTEHWGARRSRDFTQGILEAEEDKACDRKAMQTAIKLKSEYGVNVIHYGDKLYRKLMRLTDNIKEWAECSDDENRNKIQEEILQRLISLKPESANTMAMNALAMVVKTAAELEPQRTTDPQNLVKAVLRLQTTIRSQALVDQLRATAERRDDWYETWRIRPIERDSNFIHLGNIPNKDENNTPILIRTYPGFEPAFSKKKLPLAIKRIQSELAPSPLKSGPRIIRFALPRGGGKSHITSLLSQPEVLQEIYDSNASSLGGAFICQMTLSIEFSSVISAFADFLVKEIRYSARATVRRIADEFLDAPKQRPNPYKFAQHLLNSLPEGAATDVKKSLEEEFGFEFGETSMGNNHRIETLRLLLALRSMPLVCDQTRRFIFCFSRPDLLCDEGGDAYNPFHRMFFRLISGISENGDQTEWLVPQPPMDVLLLSGRPSVPITYLSEAEHDSANAHLNSPDRIRMSKTGQRLKRWAPLPHISWSERDWLKEIKHKTANTYESHKFHKKIQDIIDNIATSRNAQLARLLEKNVILSDWTARCWVRRFESVPYTEDDPGRSRFIMQLNNAASTRGFEGVLTYILDVHRKLDEQDLEPGNQHPPFDLILKHLALFQIPVEINVLIETPELNDHLWRELNKGDPLHGVVSKDDDAASMAHYEQRITMMNNWLDQLIQRGLVMRMNNHRSSNENLSKHAAAKERLKHRFSIHARLRAYLTNQMELPVLDEGDKNHYQVSIYCDQPRDLPAPSSAHYKILSDLANSNLRRMTRVVAAMRVMFSDAPPPAMDRDDNDFNENYAPKILARRLIKSEDQANEFPHAAVGGRLFSVTQVARSFYGLIRGTFSISAISRLDSVGLEPNERPFDTYRNWLGQLSVISVLVDSARKGLEDGQRQSENNNLKLHDIDKNTLTDALFDVVKQDLRRVLYRDEIAWLYNERALVSFVQGRIYDAIPLFKRALNAIGHDRPPNDDNPSLHATERRIELNLALARLERGRIQEARKMLMKLSINTTSTSKFRMPSQTSDLAWGYIGLCDYLGGNTSTAGDAFDAVLDVFKQQGKLRICSIFAAYKADMLRTLNRKTEALDASEEAVRHARHIQQMDVLHLAQLRKAACLIAIDSMKNGMEALSLCERAETYAVSVGLPKIEQSSLAIQAKLLLRRGEARLAGDVASRSLALATRHGMKLRKLDAAMIYGDVLLGRGQKEAARDLFEASLLEAQSINYQLLAGRLSARLTSVTAN